MGATLLQAVAALVGRLQRAARRMAAGAGGCGGGKGSPPRAAVAPWKKLAPTGKAARKAEAGVWRKEILMGERCQPLDFSGVIYYDVEDRRLAHPPLPRSPMRSPFPASPRVNLLSIKSGMQRFSLQVFAGSLELEPANLYGSVWVWFETANSLVWFSF